MEVSYQLKRKIDEYVKSQCPKEACGFIIDNDFVPVPNVHKKPEESFAVENGVFEKFAVNCTAFIHSHPNWYACPSEKDMRQQIATAIPWGIVGCTKDAVTPIIFFGDTVEKDDLKNRPFIHGVSDCYSAIRDWFKERKGIVS